MLKTQIKDAKHHFPCIHIKLFSVLLQFLYILGNLQTFMDTEPLFSNKLYSFGMP